MHQLFDKRIREMAGSEKWPLPAGFDDSLERMLSGLEESPVRRRRLPLKGVVILAAVLALTASLSVAAAVNYVQQRMESLNREKLREYFEQLYSSQAEADTYNRPFTEEESLRMERLRTAYETEGRFPKGAVKILEDYQDYHGKGVAFWPERSAFFFPEEEMSDEELLQIIDFRYQLNYSLQKMNRLVEAGEEKIPQPQRGGEVTATAEEILESDKRKDAGQELTIPYQGTVELECMTAGPEGLYLAGRNGQIHKMEIGGNTSTPFYEPDLADGQNRILCMTVGPDKILYAGVWRNVGEPQEKRRAEVWSFHPDGTVLNKIDVSQYTQGSTVINRIAVDAQGYLYLRVPSEEIALVIDKEGGLVAKIKDDAYCSNLSHGFGAGRDGKIYTFVYGKNDADNNGIAAIDPRNGALGGIFGNILPDAIPATDLMTAGVETDFIFCGYSGIYTYNLGDEKAQLVMEPYKLPCEPEGSRFTALPDGRIVFAACREVKEVQGSNGVEYHWRPDQTTFYYVPAVKR